jgi:hypothetical protein
LEPLEKMAAIENMGNKPDKPVNTARRFLSSVEASLQQAITKAAAQATPAVPDSAEENTIAPRSFGG